MQSLKKKFAKELGKPAYQIIKDDIEDEQKFKKSLQEAEKELTKASQIEEETNQTKQKIKDLRLRKERTEAQIEELGSNLENEAKLRELKQLKNNYEKDLQEEVKELNVLKKQKKALEDAEKKVVKLRGQLLSKKRERVEIQQKLYSTKELDELNGQEEELKRLNEQDQAIIDDENAQPSEKNAAEERLARRQEEIDGLNTQIKERERAIPLRDRVKEIFKKYGVTVASVFLAAGVTIGVVLSAMTNSLKKLGKDLGNGLKELGKKAADAIPGLLGSIVSFIFKTAGQAIGFLAEHTWLLIVGVVAFLIERMGKN